MGEIKEIPFEEEQKEPEKADSKSALIILLVIVAFIALFFLVMKIRSGEHTRVYNGFTFVETDGIWQTQWQREGQTYVLDFRHTPDEVETVSIIGKTDNRFQLENTYLTFDPQEDRTKETAYLAVAAAELSRKLVTPFERNVTAACTRNETTACADRDTVTCESTNSTVLYLRQAEPAQVELRGNCVIFQGNHEDLVRAVDKALFQWLGIMK